MVKNKQESSGQDSRKPFDWPYFFRLVIRIVVVLFVSWHLTFLLVRNVDSVAEKNTTKWTKKLGVGPAYAGLNKWARRYERALGIDQNWTMFESPVARGANFPAVRIEFDDGSSYVLLSDNEPQDPTSYLRHGKTRLRKLESKLLFTFDSADELAKSYRCPIWERYVRWRLAVWREQNPDDGRQPVRLILVRRRYALPSPREDPAEIAITKEVDLYTFNADGEVQP